MKSPIIIHTADPLSEIWQRLGLLKDQDLAFEQVMARQPDAPERGAKKQAEQIGYCIRQAEEYFSAASSVKLPTKPLLLYYGAASLGQALVLLKRDGTHSLDYMRTHKKHRHHGLELITQSGTAQTSRGPVDFLEKLEARMVAKRTDKGSSGSPQILKASDVEDLKSGKATFEPWGGFALFYQALERAQCVFERPSMDPSGKMTYILLRPSVEILPVADLLVRPVTAAEALASLPDLYSIMPAYKWPLGVCRGSQECSAIFNRGQWLYEDNFFLDGLDQPTAAKLEAYFRSSLPNARLANVAGTSIRVLVTYIGGGQQISPPLESPRLVDDLGGRIFHSLNPETMIVEPAAMYILLFQLGMLARYQPDVWMHKLDKDVSTGSFISTALGIIQRKFPLLMCDQLFSEKHIIKQ